MQRVTPTRNGQKASPAQLGFQGNLKCFNIFAKKFKTSQDVFVLLSFLLKKKKVSVSEGIHNSLCVEIKGQLEGLHFLLLPGGRTWTRVFRISSKCLFSLRHLALHLPLQKESLMCKLTCCVLEGYVYICAYVNAHVSVSVCVLSTKVRHA